MFSMSSVLPSLPNIDIVDVGAMHVGEGAEPYAALLKAAPCNVVGFEPLAVEFEKLNAMKSANRRFLPFFIGDGSTHIFHECSVPNTSSLFEPNTELLSKFHNLEELVRVSKTYPVQTMRLDDISEIKSVDFLKVDVQGAELLVFNGAVETLKNVLVIQTEVEFVALYKNQPLFSDIDLFLRKHGFQFHRLVDRTGLTFKPLFFANGVNAETNQWLWGDAVYVRDFMSFDNLTPSALLKLAIILHDNYRSVDLAASALEAYDRGVGSQLQLAYIQKLISPFSQQLTPAQG